MNALIIWNGVASAQVSGGDNYTANLINLSEIKKDIILSKNAEKLIQRNANAQLYHTLKKSPKNILSLLLTYLIRAIQSLSLIKKLNKNYDIAVSSTPFFYDVLPIIFSKAKNKAVIIFHTLPERKSSNFSTALRFLLANIEQKMSYFLIRNNFDTIIAGNPVVKKELSRYFANQKIIVTNASINTSRIDKVKAVKEKNLACFAGRIVSQKGVFDLIEIMRGISEKYPKLRLVMMGDGPEKGELSARIKKAGIKSIQIAGFVSEEEKIRILKRSKFFFFPSYEEGWGIALAEALYCNCVCICYELPHYKHLFNNYPIYVKLGDKTDFIAKAVGSFNKTPNKNQKEFVKRYDDKQVIKEILSKLEN